MKAKFVGKKIIEALTREQIAQFLDATFTLWDEQKTNDLLSHVDKDIAATVSQIFSPGTPLQERIVSDEKYIEEWKDIWAEWFAIVGEIAKEQGKYFIWEPHEKSPYLNHRRLTDDLENVAGGMLSLLEKVYEMGRESDSIFEEAIHEIEDTLRNSPEQIVSEDRKCLMGNLVTHCLMKWKWLAAETPVAFLNSVVLVEKSLQLIETEKEAVFDFFMELSEESRRQIYEYLTLNRETSVWHHRLNTVESVWHRIYHAFLEEFHHEAYIEACYNFLSQKWHYGIPVIEAFSGKENIHAEKICEKTIASFVREMTRNAEWHPETLLLISVLKHRYKEPKNDILRILKKWIGIAAQLNMSEKSEFLKFQFVTYQSPYDWDKISKAVQESSSELSHLILQWEQFILTDSLGQGFENQDCWLKWLMDAGLDEAKGGAWLCKKTENWMRLLTADPEKFQSQQSLIQLLTWDIIEITGLSEMKRVYPCFSERIREGIYQEKKDVASRRNWLRKMGAEKYLPMIMKCWRKNVAKIVPDPTDASDSNYNSHALGLGVVRELDPSAYEAILESWKRAHKRRRNLWKTLQERGLTSM